jgi:hypothetical protein
MTGSDILTLTLRQARLLHLAAQGLLTRPRRRATKADVLAAIERLQLLQIDTIHVVARSPYLVLFSRLGAYEPRWLDELLDDGAIMECWAHEACFAPIGQWPLHQRRVSGASAHWAFKHAERVDRSQRAAMDRMLAHVREHGPVKSSDFERTDGGRGGWWGWKDEKRVLEALFAFGELMVTRRERFQRVYDLTERVLAKPPVPKDIRAAAPSADAIRRELILRGARALGVAPARWLADYFRIGPRLRDADLEPLVAAGELVRVAVQGWDTPGYVHRANAALLEDAARGRLVATRTVVLSPFDPVVWDRERAQRLFGFEYRIECYTPAPRRVHGYFVLPILRRGALVGRLDAKAHRADGVFEIRRLSLEPGVAASAALVADLAQAFRDVAAWHGTPELAIRRSDPKELAAALRRAR